MTLHAGDQVVSFGRWRPAAAGPSHRHRGRQTGGGYRVALLADAASSEDVEVLDFRKPPEAPPAATPSSCRPWPRACRRRRAAAGRAASPRRPQPAAQPTPATLADALSLQTRRPTQRRRETDDVDA